jgi:hypothetical protein
MIREDGSVMKGNELEKDMAEEGPVMGDGMAEPIGTDESAIGDGSARRDWRAPLINCIKNPGSTTDKKLRRKVLRYMLIDGDVYRRTIDGILLKCLDDEQARMAIWEVHEGICGAHQSAHKMRWLLRRAGLYWPTMVGDCIKYQKGCDACQWFGNLQLAPASV